MTPSDSKAMNDSMRVDIPPCGIGAQAAYVRGFAAGHAHAREQVAAQLEDRADGLTGEHAGFSAAELREEAEKIRSWK